MSAVLQTHSPSRGVLASRIAAFQLQLAQAAPPEVVQQLGIEIEKMMAGHPGAEALRVGDLAPGFVLHDVDDAPVDIRRVLAGGPAVVTFYRGSWCPYCDLQLRAFQEVLPEIEALSATLIAISPQTVAQTLTTAEKAALKFTVVADPDNAVARSFGLSFRISAAMNQLMQGFGIDLRAFNGVDSLELPVPATFIIGTDSRIRFAFVDADYRQRLEPAELLEQLRRVTASA